MPELGVSNAQLILSAKQTAYMVFVSLAAGTVLAMIMAFALVLTRSDSILPNRFIYGFLNTIINTVRSVPFIILMVAMLPVAKAIVGTSLGNRAVIVTLVIAAAPYVARMVESSLKEVPAGVIEAAQAMGCTNLQIIWHVLLPEAKPSLISGCVISTVTILSYTALAATLGGTGLGQLAIIHGHQRSKKLVVWGCVLLIVVIVQHIQIVGTTVDRKTDKRAR